MPRFFCPSLFHVAPQGNNKSSVLIFSSDRRYIGELQAGRRQGQGSFLYPDGSSYEGQWQDNVQHGQLTGSGALPDGGFVGISAVAIRKVARGGTCYYATGARYEGQFDGGKSHGRGTYFYANGNR
ncbi:unnamed protein product [Ectocarpus sp. 13 AM-2016]